MDDANVRIADLMDPAGAQQRARERELADALKGQTGATADEMRRLYESLWQLEDAATAAATAAEAMAAAQQMMDDASIRIADLQDPEGAKDRARQRELMDALKGQTRESAEEIRRLYESLWQLEDAATAATAAAEAMAAAQKMMDEANVRIADLMDPAGAQQRARERDLAEALKGQTGATADELRRLYESLWQLEDAATAAQAAAEALARAQEQKADLEMRYMELTGSDAEILAARRAKERAETEQTNWALLDLIYAREDEIAALEKYKEAATRAIEDEYQARIGSIDGQKAYLSQAHDVRMEEIEKQRAAAQAALQEAEAALSAIQSALNAIRSSREFDELAHARAAKQLAQWAEGGWLPRTDQLERTLDVLARSAKEDFATEQQWRLSQGKTFANLLKIEAVAAQRVMWETAVLSYLDKEQERMEEQLRLEQAAIDAQMQHAEAWRDEQMAALTALLATNQAGQMTDAPIIPLPTQTAALAEANAAQTSEIKGLREEIAMLRKDMAAAATAQVAPLKSLDDRTRKWDLDGLPAGRDDVTVLRAA
jgi:hypothetical protein